MLSMGMQWLDRVPILSSYQPGRFAECLSHCKRIRQVCLLSGLVLLGMIAYGDARDNRFIPAVPLSCSFPTYSLLDSRTGGYIMTLNHMQNRSKERDWGFQYGGHVQWERSSLCVLRKHEKREAMIGHMYSSQTEGRWKFRKPEIQRGQLESRKQGEG